MNTQLSTSIHQKIHENAVTISAQYKKSEAALLEILEQVENHKVYLHQGHSSLFKYAVQALQLSENVVYNLITVMRKVREVPALRAAIRQGDITLSNARRIVPLLTNQNQTEWLKKATELSQRALEKEIVKIHPKSSTPERASYVTESRIKLELGLSEQEMLKLRRVQDLVSQSKASHASLEVTLIELTAFYLKHKDPVLKAKRIQVKKGFSDNVEPSGEQGKEPTGMVQLVSRQVQDTVNKRESIPASILHQVNIRDQRRCTFINAAGERCSQTRWTEIHHRIPVVYGGKNVLNNLITVCSTHHDWIHRDDNQKLFLNANIIKESNAKNH